MRPHSALRSRRKPTAERKIQNGAGTNAGLAGCREGCGWRGTTILGVARMPLLIKHALLALGSALWLVGLADQFHSLGSTATYLIISMMMAAVAVL